MLVNQSLLMNCQEYHFTYPVDVYVKPANYSVQVLTAEAIFFSFNNRFHLCSKSNANIVGYGIVGINL